MSTTVRQLITRSLRFLNVVSEGNPAPFAYAFDNALVALTDLYRQYIAMGAFGEITDVLTAADYTAGENERVINSGAAAITVTLPTTITENGTARAPYDRAFVLVAADDATYLYDADQADWVRIETLTLDSTAPLSQRYGSGLAALLAASLAPEYGVVLDPVTVALADEGARSLRIRRIAPAVLDPALRALNWRLDVFDITNG